MLECMLPKGSKAELRGSTSGVQEFRTLGDLGC
jgi:hypothetical protein